MITIDANLWIYYIDRGLPEHDRVRPEIRALLGTPLLTNTTLQMEVAHYLTRRFGPVQGGALLDAFLAIPFRVDALDEDAGRRAMELLKRHAHLGIGGRDATILAAMQRHGSTELWTHDDALKRVPGVTVSDPVEKARPKS